MQYTKETNRIHLVLDAGDEVIESLIALARKEDLPSASFTGIGAIGDATLGYFDLEKKEYMRKTFPGSYELVSLVGSLAWDAAEPIVHAHACISGPDFTPRAGHLFKGTVPVTGEIFLTINEIKLARGTNNEFGLKLIELE
jgi:predicted DNA-binding protein with PD1-like motif